MRKKTKYTIKNANCTKKVNSLHFFCYNKKLWFCINDRMIEYSRVGERSKSDVSDRNLR